MASPSRRLLNRTSFARFTKLLATKIYILKIQYEPRLPILIYSKEETHRLIIFIRWPKIELLLSLTSWLVVISSIISRTRISTYYVNFRSIEVIVYANDKVLFQCSWQAHIFGVVPEPMELVAIETKELKV